jgi:hypothetical protein
VGKSLPSKAHQKSAGFAALADYFQRNMIIICSKHEHSDGN